MASEHITEGSNVYSENVVWPITARTDDEKLLDDIGVFIVVPNALKIPVGDDVMKAERTKAARSADDVKYIKSAVKPGLSVLTEPLGKSCTRLPL